MPVEDEIWAEISGRRLFGLRSGQGAPVVILDAGLGDTSAGWQAIQAQAAAFTTVVSYDRAGLGRSVSASGPRTSQDIVQDLRAWLCAAKVKPPYIYVAHSWSGFQARWFANHYPNEMAGMLLVDAVHEDKYAMFAEVLSPERAERMWRAVRDPAQNDEQIDRLASIEQVRASRRDYSFPLVVLTRADDGDPLSQIETRLQQEFLKLSANSRQLFSRFANHFIHQAEPDLVVGAIRELVHEAHREGQ